jgi:hypothetical protein
MIERSIVRLWVFLAAAPTAALAGRIAYNMLGISLEEIRIAALIDAALLAVICRAVPCGPSQAAHGGQSGANNVQFLKMQALTCVKRNFPSQLSRSRQDQKAVRQLSANFKSMALTLVSVLFPNWG